MACNPARHEWRINNEQRYPDVGQRCVCGGTEWPACDHRQRNPNFDGSYCNVCRRNICPYQNGPDAPLCGEPSDGLSPWCAAHHKHINDLADAREKSKPPTVIVTLERLTEAMRIATDEALRRYYNSGFRESWNGTDPKFLALLFETLSAAPSPAPNHSNRTK